MQKQKNSYLLLIFVLAQIVFISCGNKKVDTDKTNEVKIIKTETSEIIESDYLFLLDVDCLKQTKGLRAGKKKLLFFDSKGMFDEATYKQSPSALFKSALSQNSEFKKLAKQKFDFINLTQDCEIGKGMANKYSVQLFPCAVLLDEKGEVIFNKPAMNIGMLITQVKKEL